MESDNIQSRRNFFETQAQQNQRFLDDSILQRQTERNGPGKNRFWNTLEVIGIWMKTSRLAGIPLAIIFGLYFYYFITFLILSDIDKIDLNREIKVELQDKELNPNFSPRYSPATIAIQAVFQ